jgi:CheY-like chemotaxis protein
VASILDKHGYHVTTAADGREAMIRITGDPPDLVLMDINMPNMDGFEALERIKTTEEWARIPVIVLTGAHLDRPSRLRALELGADDFLPKPFDEEELVVRIRNHTRLKMLCEVEIEKERIKGALLMAQAAVQDMRGLLQNILETAELIVYDRSGGQPREKYFKRFKEDVQEFVSLTERLSVLDF